MPNVCYGTDSNYFLVFACFCVVCSGRGLGHFFFEVKHKETRIERKNLTNRENNICRICACECTVHTNAIGRTTISSE